MALELQITGPGFSASRILQPGDPALVLGRDADCGVCLPDHQRNVSRQHLALRNEDDRLEFAVLSSVNGIVLPSGPCGPGARGLLLAGEALRLAGYRVTIALLPVQLQDLPARLKQGPVAAAQPAGRLAEDDPFGDWGLDTGFGTGGRSGTTKDSERLVPAADLAAFFRGVGLDPQRIGLLTDSELEDMGKLVQSLVQGLLRAWQALPPEGRNELRNGRATTANPLMSRAPILAKLHYLFGGPAAHGNSMPPDRAVHQLLAQLLAQRAHDGEGAHPRAPEPFIPDATPGERP